MYTFFFFTKCPHLLNGRLSHTFLVSDFFRNLVTVILTEQVFLLIYINDNYSIGYLIAFLMTGYNSLCVKNE